MRLSTRGTYGTRALLELALHYGERPVILSDIAKSQGVSAQYLEHVLSPLKAAGLIKSARGAHGGFSLAKPPWQIKLSEVIQILEGSLAPTECVDNPSVCPRSATCVTRDIWAEIKRVTSEVLDSRTLQDLVKRQKEKNAPAPMYHI